MKHSQTLGVIFSILLIVSCFIPWSFIASKNIVISGMESAGTNYMKPGILHIFFAVFAILFFTIRRVWSKRSNLLVNALNLGWAIRNFILMSFCFGGDCPEKRFGIYLVLVSSILMLVMSFLPKLEVIEKKKKK